MRLTTYRKKRDFDQTPEPKPVPELRSQEATFLKFVIQKHEARRLHYDLRLELYGVLKSWAVPKGPSMDPEEKRLAVMVEDHPIEYGSFEGVIPKGNYGAGRVTIWDEGVYTHIEAGDSREKAEKLINAGLQKGHVDLVFLGKKLKGSFALVKIKSQEDNNWLLIKKADEYAKKSKETSA